MKLLIITQKVDRNDPILGFFCRWIEEFAKHCEKIIVICLEKGKYNLPPNVGVLSLGKESGQSKVKYVWRFYKYIWQERKNYDAVFVHMNQEYVLLGWKFWKLWGKKIYLWRNHAFGGFLTRIAILVSNKVFCTSPQSFTARFKKTKIMPVGIDTDFFRPDPNVKKIPRSILALGRISPIKRLDILINALLELQKQKIDFTATIVGSPIFETDILYERELHRLAEPLTRSGRLSLCPAVRHSETLDIYRSHEIYVNLTPTGSMDKTILEAMACGALVIWSESQPAREIAVKGEIKNLLNMDDVQKNDLRLNLLGFAQKHSLVNLANSLYKYFL
jgi:glycosyltransferase involved in cell wall biosynthesis